MTHASRMKQMIIYYKQCRRSFANEKGWKILISVVLMTLILCSVTGKDMFKAADATRTGAFAIVCAGIWIGLFNSIRTICREREIIRKEHRTGLHMSAYAAAHWLHEAGICLVEAVVVTLIVRVMNFTHFIKHGIILLPSIDLGITIFLVLLSADALGLLISAVVKDENTAMTVMPFALLIEFAMSGMIFDLEGIPVYVSTLTISRWGLDAICTVADVNSMSYFAYSQIYQPTPGTLLPYWMLLLVFAVIYGILTAAALEFIDKY